jgi:NADH dehydrogenase
MAKRCVAIFGGTGFLGRRIAAVAAGADWDVRVAVRLPRPDLWIGQAVQPEQTPVDIREAEQVRRAVDGAAAVVNAVSLYVETRTDSFESVHVSGAANVARAAARCEAGLVHLSGIGVDPESPSKYVRARTVGEQRTHEACSHSVILRPSAMFGPDDAFLSAMTQMIRWLPLIPLFGRGVTRVQPVHVDDVARAVVNALDRDEARGRVFELGGPEVFTYRKLVRTLCERLGRRRLLVPVPFVLWNAIATMVSILPNPPLTRDQIELVRRDNVAQSPGFAELGIEKDSLRRIGDAVASGRP